MKKNIACISALVLILSLSACTANLNKYKKDPDDGYIMENYITGGNESITGVEIGSVELSNWLGCEKLSFEFMKNEDKAGGIPKYEVFLVNDRSEIQIKLYGCKSINGDISEAFESEHLKNCTAKQKDDTLIIDLTFTKGLKYMFEEFAEPSLLVLNVKEIT